MSWRATVLVIKLFCKEKFSCFEGTHTFLTLLTDLPFMLYSSYILQSACSYPFRTTGLYTKTLAKIIQQDLTRFMAVFVVVFFPFCGALFISLRCCGQNLLFRYALILEFATVSRNRFIHKFLATLECLSSFPSRRSFLSNTVRSEEHTAEQQSLPRNGGGRGGGG